MDQHLASGTMKESMAGTMAGTMEGTGRGDSRRTDTRAETAESGRFIRQLSTASGAEDQMAQLRLQARASVAGAQHRARLVDLEELIKFVFPAELQHAMSTGRLLAFGLYGPLDSDARLRSGHKGSHVVGRWELDTMCRQFEREDILQVRPSHHHHHLAFHPFRHVQGFREHHATRICTKGEGGSPTFGSLVVCPPPSHLQGVHARGEECELAFRA